MIPRYLYADYTFGSVLQRALREGVTRMGLHYDIMCHYLVNFWDRVAELKPPLQPLTRDSFESFIASHNSP
jgi:hypothetical protein